MKGRLVHSKLTVPSHAHGRVPLSHGQLNQDSGILDHCFRVASSHLISSDDIPRMGRVILIRESYLSMACMCILEYSFLGTGVCVITER